MSSAISLVQSVSQDGAAAATTALQTEDKKKTAKEFEAMFLRQTLESILPESKNEVFGGGTAGGMWRSMLADRVSTVLAERGVLGFSNMLNVAKDSQ